MLLRFILGYGHVDLLIYVNTESFFVIHLCLGNRVAFFRISMYSYRLVFVGNSCSVCKACRTHINT